MKRNFEEQCNSFQKKQKQRQRVHRQIGRWTLDASGGEGECVSESPSGFKMLKLCVNKVTGASNSICSAGNEK